MSVYCLGKLISQSAIECRVSLQASAKEAGMAVSFDVDPEDVAVLSEPPELSGDGVVFAAHSEAGDSDVVKVWNDAQDVGLKAFRAIGSTPPDRAMRIDELDLPAAVERELRDTSIGNFAAAIIQREKTLSGGIALFDGCIEQTIRATPEECLRRILTSLLIPWDCGPDALYIWQRR